MTTKRALENLRNRLQTRLDVINKQLHTMPDGNLSIENRHGTLTYVITELIDGKRRRRSLAKHPTEVNELLRAKVLKAEASRLSHNITLLAAVITKYQLDPSPEFMAKTRNKWPATDPFPTEDPLMSPEAITWAKAPYEQSTRYPEQKKHKTRNGILVRSKSELLIAERLADHHLPFHYEEIIMADSIPLAPDFTIKRADGKLMYWEHMGMTHAKKYLETQLHKIQLYAGIDIVPWDNLIITFDDAEGSVDMLDIDTKIQNRLLI